MNIPLFTSTGTQKGEKALPASLFGAEVNKGLIHLALIRQQSNRRNPIAHTLTRAEISGSNRKLYAQKGTGRARRGTVRSPLLRGGSKSFGPKNNANFEKGMPKTMRKVALRSCLSLRAQKEGVYLALESYSETALKTKDFLALLKKLPVTLGRRIIIVTPEKHQGVYLSCRNIPGVKLLQAAYLNPEDVLGATNIVFVADAIERAEKLFGSDSASVKEVASDEEGSPAKKIATKKTVAKKAPAKKVASKTSAK